MICGFKLAVFWFDVLLLFQYLNISSVWLDISLAHLL